MPAHPAFGQPPLPVESGVDEVGRTDGAVVTRGMVAVRREPCGRFVLEFLDRDHRVSMSKCHV
jgi:hypothetical protein